MSEFEKFYIGQNLGFDTMELYAVIYCEGVEEAEVCLRVLRAYYQRKMIE